MPPRRNITDIAEPVPRVDAVDIFESDNFEEGRGYRPSRRPPKDFTYLTTSTQTLRGSFQDFASQPPSLANVGYHEHSLNNQHLGYNENTPSELVNEVLKGLGKGYAMSAPLYVDDIPQELHLIAKQMYNPRELGDGWRTGTTMEEEQLLGMNYVVNESQKVINVNFSGFDARDINKDNVFKHIPRNDTKAFEQSAHYQVLEPRVEYLVERARQAGFRIKFHGHSYGAYLARYFGQKFGVDQELLNAHTFPWNTFPEPPNATAANFHTTITDPTDFKHVLPYERGGENHFYYPGNETARDEGLFGQSLDGHYIKSFDVSQPKTMNQFLKAKTVARAVGAGLLALNVVGAVEDAKAGADPTNVNSGGEGISGFTELAFVGVNPDPEATWSDERPPKSGLDWLAYQAVQPVKGVLKDLTGRSEEEKYLPEVVEGTVSTTPDEWQTGLTVERYGKTYHDVEYNPATDQYYFMEADNEQIKKDALSNGE